jgi:hypothetical protein
MVPLPGSAFYFLQNASGSPYPTLLAGAHGDLRSNNLCEAARRIVERAIVRGSSRERLQSSQWLHACSRAGKPSNGQSAFRGPPSLEPQSPARPSLPVGRLDAAEPLPRPRYIGVTGCKDPTIRLRMLQMAKQAIPLDAVVFPANGIDCSFRSFVFEASRP